MVLRGLFYCLLVPFLGSYSYDCDHSLNWRTPNRCQTLSLPQSSTTLLATSSSEERTPEPLYITVGPPCSGKTSWLRSHGSSIQDIALDDQTGVYRPLLSHYFIDDDADSDAHIDLKEVVAGKTLYERLMAPEQAELRSVCRHVAGKLTPVDLGQQLMDIHNARRRTTTFLIPVLLHALKDCLTAKNPALLPSTVDLFCGEVLFTKINNATALERAHDTLRTAPPSQAVAWGNTNLRPTDYREALQIAADQRRPVHFCVFDACRTQLPAFDEQGGSARNESKNEFMEISSGFPPDAFDLKADSFQELMRRNVQRLLETGRYIPSMVLWDMLQRSRENMRRLVGNDLQQALARSSRFARYPGNGTVTPLRRAPNQGKPRDPRAAAQEEHWGSRRQNNRRWSRSDIG
jgi:hypothetical protein